MRCLVWLVSQQVLDLEYLNFILPLEGPPITWQAAPITSHLPQTFQSSTKSKPDPFPAVGKTLYLRT